MSTVDVVSIETPNLGDRSYVVGRGDTAVVIDPQRDIDRVQEVLDDRGWTVSHVLETHFHNDYVSGGLELARAVGAEYVVPDGMAIDFTARQVADKDEIESGAGLVRVLHTPGHTPNHISFAVNDGGEDVAVEDVVVGIAAVEARPAVGFVHLVVTGPEGEAGVRAEAFDDLDGFGGEAALEVVVLRIQGAGEREVLPHEDAGLITEIEEEVVFVNIAAPAAEQIATERGGLCDDFGDACAIA